MDSNRVASFINYLVKFDILPNYFFLTGSFELVRDGYCEVGGLKNATVEVYFVAMNGDFLGEDDLGDVSCAIVSDKILPSNDSAPNFYLSELTYFCFKNLFWEISTFKGENRFFLLSSKFIFQI